MGHELMDMYPEFARTVMICERQLRSHGYPGCLEVIAPKDEAKGQLPNPTQPQSFQVGIFVLEVALAFLFMSWGITPTAVVGHR